MPRTRNVTRAQWDAANAATTGDQNQHHDCESEKENQGRTAMRTTRSQTRTHSNGNRAILGSTTTTSLRISTTSKGLENTASTNTSKVKGKGKAKAPPPKRKKLPLQDITSQFLPAPEAANRGQENEAAEHGSSQQTENRVNLVSPLPLAQGDALGPMISNHSALTYLDSPLPPSSPPSAITSSPQYPRILPQQNTSWLGLSYQENNLLNEFDNDQPTSSGSPNVISSNSDPFGFVALERKLKVERGAAAPSPLKRRHQQDESDEELELGQVLVADTSSPRLVRRLKRPSYQDDDSTLPPVISEYPHYATPPTPHKDKKRRLSHEEDGRVRLSSPSIPSTPSPSKPFVNKSAREARREGTPKNKLNDKPEVESVFRKTRSRTGRGIVKGEPSMTSKVTATPLELGASEVETEEERVDPKPPKATKPKRNPKKTRSIGTKKSKKEETADKNDNDEDCAEVCSFPAPGYSIKLIQSQKWERERQDRAAYFKRLEGYQVEKEDVYVI